MYTGRPLLKKSDLAAWGGRGGGGYSADKQAYDSVSGLRNVRKGVARRCELNRWTRRAPKWDKANNPGLRPEDS